MALLIAFVVAVVIGDLFAVGVARAVEYFSKPASLIVFLILFMGVIPLAWRVAVRFTEPRDTAKAK